MSEAGQTSGDERPGSAYRRSVENAWRTRLALLLFGGVLALLALSHFYHHRVTAHEAALGPENQALTASFDGQRINAWQMEEFEEVYGGARDDSVPPFLWLGNSQMHAINRVQPGDSPAPKYASDALSRPVYCLSLPNASLQEHLVLLRWAMLVRPPEVLVISLVYDDLREDGLRPEFRHVHSPELVASLGGSTLGARLAAELETIAAGSATDAQGTTRKGLSLQERTEAKLDSLLSSWSPLWARRADVLTGIRFNEIYNLRNWVFGITATTKRPMIAVREEQNMRALEEIVALCRDHSIELLLYVAPVRWDIEPPYFLDQYEAWKSKIERSSADGVRVENLDHLVPGELWDTGAGHLDFMHFGGEGHRLLGERVAEIVRGPQA